MKLAIVIPALNEGAGIADALGRLQPLRARGVQLIVVDGGSHDDTAVRAAPLADRVLVASRGRAVQMNAGARHALESGAEALVFLHADTELPPDADRAIAAALANGRHAWGRFDVQISGTSPWLPVVAAMMNWRSRLTGIATGDQAIFVSAGAWVALGGFAPLPLMEDIEFCRRARQLGRPAIPARKLITSGRRWERHGVWRTIWLMWRLRAEYFLGADPAQLARRYRDAR